MSWQSTYTKILNSVTYLFQQSAGKEQPTFMERQIIGDAVNEALLQVLVSRGVDRWNFNVSHTTATCTAGSRELTLPDGTLTVMNGSVRIPSEKQSLFLTNLECIFQSDNADEDNGIPLFYAFDSTSDPDTPQLVLAPIPDADYVVEFAVEKLCSADTVEEFPSYLHGPITDLATAITMRRLGFGNPLLYEEAYREGEMNANNKLGDDGPMHINRATYYRQTGIQHRIPQ